MSRPALLPLLTFAALAVLAGSAARGEDAAEILAPKAKLEKVASGCKFTEGPGGTARATSTSPTARTTGS